MLEAIIVLLVIIILLLANMHYLLLKGLPEFILNINEIGNKTIMQMIAELYKQINAYNNRVTNTIDALTGKIHMDEHKCSDENEPISIDVNKLKHNLVED